MPPVMEKKAPFPKGIKAPCWDKETILLNRHKFVRLGVSNTVMMLLMRRVAIVFVF
jgi:hypothetical protein